MLSYSVAYKKPSWSASNLISLWIKGKAKYPDQPQSQSQIEIQSGYQQSRMSNEGHKMSMWPLTREVINDIWPVWQLIDGDLWSRQVFWCCLVLWVSTMLSQLEWTLDMLYINHRLFWGVLNFFFFLWLHFLSLTLIISLLPLFLLTRLAVRLKNSGSRLSVVADFPKLLAMRSPVKPKDS